VVLLRRLARYQARYNQPKEFKSLLHFESRLERGRMAERKPEDAVIRMPMRVNELVVLMRCLKNALQSERTSESDKTVVREMMHRINRFAERQGARWDKLE